MRSIVLVRHAKSSWNHLGMKDADRPLNDRGKRDAPMMAERLMNANIRPELLVSSSAVRAAATARIFASTLQVPSSAIQWEQELYLPEPEAFTTVLKSLPDAVQTVCLFSHNPGITNYANRLSNAEIDNMPTCSIFAVRTDVLHWKDFTGTGCRFWFFDYPKSGTGQMYRLAEL